MQEWALAPSSALFLAALAAALWAYDGWEDLNLVGSEVENPQKNFPRALVGGSGFVAVVYLLFSAACLKVLPFDTVAASRHIGSDVVEHIKEPPLRVGSPLPWSSPPWAP